MAVNDVFRVAIEGSVTSGQVIVNVLHYEQVAEVVGAPASVLGGLVVSDLIPAYAGIASGCGFDLVRIAQVRGGLAVAEVAAGIPSSLGGDSLPPNAPVVLRKKTGLAGRSRRGRMFLFPTSEAYQSEGAVQVTGTFGSNMDAFRAQILGLGDDGGGGFQFRLTIWSKELEISTLVTDTQVSPYIKNLRSRGRK